MPDTIDGTVFVAFLGVLLGLGVLWLIVFTSVRAALRTYGREAGTIAPRPDPKP